MSNKGLPRTLRLPIEHIEKLKALPIPVSSAIKQAVMNAYGTPTLLVRALHHRIATPDRVGELKKVCYWSEEVIDEYCEHLSNMTELAKEQAVRLAVEAYINKL